MTYIVTWKDVISTSGVNEVIEEVTANFNLLKGILLFVNLFLKDLFFNDIGKKLSII